MPQFLVAPAANFNGAGQLTTLAGATLHNSNIITGLTNGVNYRLVMFSNPTLSFQPVLGGSIDITANASGTYIVSGTSIVALGKRLTGIGTLVLTGSATAFIPTVNSIGSVSGTISFSGAAAGYVGTPSDLVASLLLGAVTENSITATVTTSGLTSTTRLVVSTSPSFTSPIYSSNITPDATYFFARGTVSGLVANTTYYIAAEVGGVRDLVRTGSFKTMAASGDFVFNFASCNGDGSNHRVFDAILANNPDAGFFIHTGDWGYPDITTNDVSLFHANYNLNLSQSRQNTLWRNRPMYYMWDDHDYGGNDSSSTSAARPAAIAAYRNRVPSPPLALSGATDSPYFSFKVGRVVFAILDSRSERTTTLLPGAAQEAWLIDLMQTLAPNEVLCMSAGVPWIASTGNDTWFRAVAQRQRIADAINLYIPGRAMIICGDMHALAYDDGTNSVGGIPVFHAAALDRTGSVKGGPYSSGTPNSGPGRYGRIEITEITGGVSVTYRGLLVNGTSGAQSEVLTYTTTLVANGNAAEGSLPLTGTATGTVVSPEGTFAASGSLPLTGSAAGTVSGGAVGTIEYVGGRTQTFGGLTASTTVVNLTGLTGGLATVPAAGDLVVISFSTGSVYTSDPSIGIVAPTDFTEATELLSASTISAAHLSVNYKFMTGTPDTSVTLSGTGSAQNQGAVTVHVFRGVDPTTPLDVALTSGTGTGGLVVPPTITPITGGSLIYVAGAIGSNVFSSPNWPIPTSPDLEAFLIAGGSDTYDTGLGAGYLTWAGGTVTPGVWGGGTEDAGSAWVAATLSLRPALAVEDVTSASGTLPLTGTTTARAVAKGAATGTTSLTGSSTATAPFAAEIEYVGGKSLGIAGTLSDTTVSLTDLTGGLASAPVEGDLVIVSYGTGTNISRAPVMDVTNPLDFTKITDLRNTTGSRAAHISISYKFMTSSPDASITLATLGNLNDSGSVIIQVFRGVNTTTPMDVAFTTGIGLPGQPNPPAITPVTAGAWVYTAAVVASQSYADPTFPTLTSSDLTAFIATGKSDTFDNAMGAGYIPWTSGAVDPAAFGGGSATTGDAWAGITIALRPSASAPATNAATGTLPLTGSATATAPSAGANAAATGSQSLTGTATARVVAKATLTATLALTGSATIAGASGGVDTQIGTMGILGYQPT